MQNNSLNNRNEFDELINKIRSVRNQETLLLFLNGLMLTFSVAGFTLFMAIIVEYFAQGDTSFRLFLVIAVSIICLLTFGVTSYKNILRILNIKYLPSLNNIALRIGKIYPDVKDKLGNILQLFALTTNTTNKINISKSINNHRHDNSRGISQDLIQAELSNIYSHVSNKDFSAIINKKRSRNIFLLLLVMLFFIIVFISSFSSLGDAFYRLKNFDKSFLPPPPFTIELVTLEKTVLRGSNTIILFKSTGTPPADIILHIKEDKQQKYDEIKIKLDTNNSYRYEIASVKENICFYGEANWLTSSIITKTGSIKVSDRPIVRLLSGSLNYPSYTKLSSRVFDEQSADLTALRGSVANFNITANKNLYSAYIVFEKSEHIISEKDTNSLQKVDTNHILLKVIGEKATGNLKITQNGSYYFVLIDSSGLTNISPIKYSIVSLNDGNPTISMLFPTSDVQITEQAILPIKVAITDDYGFSSLKLYYKLAASKYSSPDKNYTSINIPVASPTSDVAVEVPFVWDLNKINIVPEDIYEFYIEVADNDIITGPKTARTQTFMLRLPSLEEVSKEADIAQDKVVEELDKLKKETEQIKKNMDELERDLRKKPNQKELDWKQQKQLQNILKRQEYVKKNMDNLSEQLQEVSQQLQQNKMLSQETMQKYQELQKLMQEVRSPQLERLQKMREEALNQLSPDEIKKAMEEARFDEEQFKKSIERTMNILKRIQAEQKTDALAKRAEELKRKEDGLNKQLNETDANNKTKLDELVKKQEQIKTETQKLSKDLQELSNLMEDIGKEEMPMEEMRDAQEALDKQNLQNDMQQSIDQMKSGEKKQADKSQKSASKKLDDFSKKMQKLKQEMQNQNSKEVVRKMQKAIDNMLDISERQKQVKNKTQKADYNSTRVPEYAQEQADLFEDLYNVASELNEIGSKSFAVTQEMASEVLRSLSQMRQAMDIMSDRRMTNAANAQLESMQSINNALAQMQSALAQMQQQGAGSCSNPGGTGQSAGSGSSGSGMGQRMQQMAAEQQALNQMMQDMMGGKSSSGQNGSMSQEQRAEMKRIADKQGEMQKSIEQLSKEQQEFGGNNPGDKTGKKISQELNNISKEMQEVTKEIQRGNVTPETIQRQEKILSRLLDATKSVNEKDFEKKRESNRGKDIQRNSPLEIDLNTQEGKSRVIQEFLQSIKRGYTKDYEQVIRKYFEQLTVE